MRQHARDGFVPAPGTAGLAAPAWTDSTPATPGPQRPLCHYNIVLAENACGRVSAN